MPRLAVLMLALIAPPSVTVADGPTLAGKNTPLKPLVTGLTNPELVCIGPDGRIYVSVLGEPGKDADGAVLVVQDGKAVPFATGLDDPRGLVSHGGFLYTADRTRILRINKAGKADVFVDAKAFPTPPGSLANLEVDPVGRLFVCDVGDGKGTGGAVYEVSPKRRVRRVADGKKIPAVKGPGGLRLASEYHLHVLDRLSGVLNQVRIRDGQTTKVADGFGGDGITFDYHGRLYLSDGTNGKVVVIPRPGMKPVLLASGFGSVANLCRSRDGKSILVSDRKVGTLTAVPCIVPGFEVDESKLPVGIELAFPDLEWTGWKGVTDAGKIVPHRPIVLTHAGDGSQRVFVATQQGIIHVFPDDQKAKKTEVFLDIESRVKYNDATNEEGLLGLAFHPNYRKTGEFFVFYTPKNEKLVNVVSRFHLSKDDPGRADPSSEEVLLRFKKPFWNHDGGTICFGPDGYLYITHGDGGAANDPFNNGQNLKSLLGKVLRIDIDRKDPGLAYAIPKDNPFVGREDARGEIWAYGVRNLWRMAFDRKTAQLWAGEVGQNLWEEIIRIERSGNYGWNLRESLHPFGDRGVGPNKGMIEPIWEYHHDIGKSITGGHVYRGSRVKALEGLYLYADYVSGTMWALRYDEKQKRVTANHVLRQGGFPVFSYGEDEKGEVYFLTSTPTGKGIFRFKPLAE